LLTGKAKRLGLSADVLEGARAAAKVDFEAPDLTEGVSVLTAA
jgi:hypothetical protein